MTVNVIGGCKKTAELKANVNLLLSEKEVINESESLGKAVQ